MSRVIFFIGALLLLSLPYGIEGADTAGECKDNLLDILFILDESGSVGNQDFQKTLTFVHNVVDRLEIGPNDVQVAVLTFDSVVRMRFHFNRFSTKQDVLTSVSTIDYNSGGTNTAAALEFARLTVFTTANGMRSHAAQVAVVITDGGSNEGGDPSPEAARLRDKGVTVFAIGVGDGPNFEELNSIATDPDDAHVFTVDNYDSLAVILSALRQSACKAEAAFLCGGQADIVFLLDVSTVYREHDLDRLRQFVTGVAERFIIGPNDVQVGVDSYSTELRHAFYLRDNTDQMSLESAVSAISSAEGDRNTANAFEVMRDESFTADAGHRDGIVKVAILVTNGQSDNSTLVSSAAREMIDAGITILAVGVGPAVDDAELKAVVTGPLSENVYKAAAFDALSSLEGDIAARLCGQVNHQSGVASPVPEHGSQADIVFMIDSSSSVGLDNFRLLLAFINTVIKDLDIGLDSTRVAVQTFNSRPHSQVSLNRYDDKEALMDATMKIEYRKGGSDIAAAIRYMDQEMFKAANGDRPGIPNLAVIMTDGQSKDPQLTSVTAHRAREGGVIIFTVGVGNETSRSDLNEMASDPDNEHVLTVADFSKLAVVRSAFLTQLYQEMPAVLPPYIPPAASRQSVGPTLCQDQISNCAAYHDSVCTSYVDWAATSCAKTCEICDPTEQTVAPPCVDNLPDCSSDVSIRSCGEDRAWARENCRESCGYCSPGTQTGGLFNKCSYKGVQYSQGDKWDDGCSYECECTDASTGRYQCYNKCPSYYNFPQECSLVQVYGECCLEPYCDFGYTHTTKNVSEACTFNRREYKEGEVWSVGCEFECICEDAARDFYTCQSKCPQYGLLPGNCQLMKPPGECCERPVCEFQTQVGRFSGGGGPSGPGLNRMNETLTQCKDRLPDCNIYQSQLCTSQTNRSFALDNCRKSCDLCDHEITLTSSPTDVCVYKGQTYKQGQTWTDGCDKTCRCENAAFGYYRCDDSCPEFLDLPEGCSMVTVPGQCCRSLYCDSPATIVDSQTVKNTLGSVPDTYQSPESGQYPTLPPGQTYAPGQNPSPDPSPSPNPGSDRESQQTSSAGHGQDRETQFGRGCDPAEEGQPTTITCDVDTTTCQNLFVAKWLLGRREFSTCTKSRCGNFISSDKMDATTTIDQTSSTLTLRDVSRTSAEYDSDTKWICSPCGGPGVTVCNGLEIYVLPENPSCEASEIIVSGETQSAKVTCSTNKIYPQAKCSFERSRNGGTPVPITTTPAYSHTPTGESPVYYRSECSVSVPVEDLGEGTHSFQGYIYPDVTRGKSLVEPITPEKTVTFVNPEAAQTEPDGCSAVAADFTAVLVAALAVAVFGFLQGNGFLWGHGDAV